VASLLAVVTPSPAVIVGGGGNPNTDCLLVVDAPVNVPARNPRDVRCADGDACDADGEVNGRCQFAIAVCANSTFDARCTLNGVGSVTVDHAEDNGDPKFDPDFQALQTRIDGAIDPPSTTADDCTQATNITVPVKGPFAGNVCRQGRKLIKITMLSTPMSGRRIRDNDRMRLFCDPAPAGCGPRALFDGTFDRIQRQIFDQTCAVSGCHDSQSQQATLLLEQGASLGNLIGVTPTNPDAAAAGWERVKLLGPDSGDPTTSFLFRKVDGNLPPGFGSRMPLVGPPLDDALIEVIRLWIEAGAPDTGWVSGTD
jgi:hypothetical protein